MNTKGSKINIAILSIYYTQKNVRQQHKPNKLIIQLQRGMMSLNFPAVFIQCQIFKIISSTS